MKRSRGQIIPRGDRKWLLRAFLGRTQEGKKYTSKVFHGTKYEAEKALTHMLRDVDTSSYVQPKRQLLAEFLKEWLEGKRPSLAPATYQDYRRIILKRLIPNLGHFKLHEVTQRVVFLFYSDLSQKEGLGPRSVRYHHSVLSQALSQAVRWGLLLRNPAANATLPKIQKRKATILTPNEVSELLSATSDSPWHPLWVLLLTTGLRPQEALGLKWEDLDDGWLQVRRVVALVGEGGRHGISENLKTEGSERRIALPSMTLAALSKHQICQKKAMLSAGESYKRQGFIFANRWGHFCDISKIRRHWAAALKAAGLPRVRLYDTRHTHISHLLMGGVDLKFASERAGHSSITLTADTYAHVLPKSEQMMAETIQELYSKEG